MYRIMIFTEGTVLKPRSFFGFFDQQSYIPVKNCIDKIRNWEAQGAEIVYLSSRRKKSLMEKTRDKLIDHGFPGTYIHYRSKNEKYRDVVETVRPDVLIEDDCRSLGGAWQTAINKVDKRIKENITSIIVREFKGIDHLPDDPAQLIGYN